MTSNNTFTVTLTYTLEHVQDLFPHLSDEHAEQALEAVADKFSACLDLEADDILKDVLRKAGYNNDRLISLDATIKWNDPTTEVTKDVVFGCLPDWFNPSIHDTEGLAGDHGVFYWVTDDEYNQLHEWTPESNFTLTDDWTLVAVDN